MAPKKAKGEKMDLGTFLQDESLGSWADEMDSVPMPAAPARSGYGGDRSFRSGPENASSREFTDRGYSVREELPLPDKPPYTVHLGNLSFDATEGDISDHFASCSVTNVRIVEEKLGGRPKGFGYVEFASLDGLKKALDLNNTQFQGRNIRVSVAEPPKDRPDARDFGNWDRKGPLPDLGQRRTSDRGFGSGPRNMDNMSETGSDRGNRRSPYEQSDGKVRDFGNWDRKGPLAPLQPTGPPARSVDRPISRDGPRDRRNSPAWGEGRSERSEAGSRPPRRDFSDRPAVERAPTAAEADTQWRTKMRPDPPAQASTPAEAPSAKSPAMMSREPSRASSSVSTPPGSAKPIAPTSRPKLNLAKRTVTEAPEAENDASVSDSKASPFGAAKPVDTATKEKEAEEKQLTRQKEKKEAEEKAAAEKKAAEEKAKEETRQAKEAEKAKAAENGSPVTPKIPTGPRVPSGARGKNGNQNNSKDSEPAPARKTYEILRRQADTDSTTDGEEIEGADANGNIVDDKSIKPQQVERDISSPTANGGSQTNGTGAQQPDSPSDPTATALEEDGWSTVPAKTKKTKTTITPAARAIAS